MKKVLQVGDIYLNPLMMDLWILNTQLNEEGYEEWVLNLVHTDFQELFENVNGFIYIGNIYDLTKKQCEKAIKKIKNGN